MRYQRFLMVLLFVLISPSRVQAQNGADPNQARLMVVRAARMLDVQSGKYVSNAVLVIEADRIKSAGSNLPVPAGAQILDLGKATLLPGLIDCHTHLLQNYLRWVGGDD